MINKFRKRRIFIVPAIIAAALLAAPTSASAATSSPSGFKPAFSDDFNGNTVDEKNWGIYDGAGNQGIGRRDRNAVSEGNGELRITGSGDTSGGLGLKTNQTYGRWEARVKLDKGAGYGSALLLWPSDGNWPQGGELDISEISDRNRTVSSSHDHYGSNNTVLEHLEQGDFTQWHTYAIDWLPDHVTWYLDGKAVWTVDQGDAVPHSPHFFGMQLDVGANGSSIGGRDASTPSNVVMHVDWVRTYTTA